MSDHNIIYIVRRFVPLKRQEIKKEVRNLKDFEADHFIYDLSNIPWENIENIDDPNVVWKIWKTIFNTILDKHAPIRHKRVKKSSVPWLNSNIKQLMQNRDFHKKQLVKHGSGTIGDFIKALEIESILKYVKINHPIFGKKSRNVIKMILRIPGS